MTNPISPGGDFLWQPLLEAAAQTIVGAIGAYAFKKISHKFYLQNTFESPMDLWQRGINSHSVDFGDRVRLECLISPYTQLFPCDPFKNAKLWRNLYDFEGKVSAQEFQAMEFYVSADETIRIGSINGESLVGLYYRYGYIGEGIVGVVSTQVLKKEFPDFFEPKFFGARAVISGTLERCPTQHGFVAQGIAKNAGIDLSAIDYSKLPYLNITSIKPFVKNKECSLLGAPWAVTDKKDEQYLLQYGYMDKPDEMITCLNGLKQRDAWKNMRVFFDDLTAPSRDVSYRRIFL